MEWLEVMVEQFIDVWGRLKKGWEQQLEERLAPELTVSQLEVLDVLHSVGEPIKPSQLGVRLDISPAATTTLLDRMERGNLIERRRDEVDKRFVWVYVTAHGDEQRERGRALRNDCYNGALDRISKHNQQVLVFLLNKIISHPS